MKIARGIWKGPTSYRAFVRVSKTDLRSKTFPLETDLKEMKRWRELQRVAEHYALEIGQDDADTFAADVKTYLSLVQGMPSIQDRTYRMHEWAAVFGLKPRASITSLDIRQQLEKWRVKGHADGKHGLSAASLNQRRTALMHFFTVMNGKSGANPVKDVPPYREEELPLELPSFSEAERAIANTIHPLYPKKKGKGRKTQARLYVLLYTGWPSAVLKRLKPQHLQLDQATATVHGRRKGRGTKPKQLPLSEKAVEALRVFDEVDAYGDFSGSSLHSALQRGCEHAGITPFRVYDLRHVFATAVVKASPDERGAAELIMSQQIRRYSRHAASERASAALDAAFPRNSVTSQPSKPGKDRQTRKLHRPKKPSGRPRRTCETTR